MGTGCWSIALPYLAAVLVAGATLEAQAAHLAVKLREALTELDMLAPCTC